VSATRRASQQWQCRSQPQHTLFCESDMELSPERYRLLVEAIENSTAIDELAALRKEIRLSYAGDERVRLLDAMIDQQARFLMDHFRIDEGDD